MATEDLGFKIKPDGTHAILLKGTDGQVHELTFDSSGLLNVDGGVVSGGGGGGGDLTPPVTLTQQSGETDTPVLTIQGNDTDYPNNALVRIIEGIAANPDAYAPIFQLVDESNHTALEVFSHGSLEIDGLRDGVALSVSGVNGGTEAIASFGSDTGVTLVARHGLQLVNYNSAPPDNEINVHSVSLWFDDTHGAAKLMIKAKDAVNTLISESIAFEIIVAGENSAFNAEANHMYYCDASSGDIGVGLPEPVSGVRVIIKNAGASGTVTVSPHSAESIDGGSSTVISTQYQSLTFIADGSNWWII